jgi:CARDB protein
MFVRMLGKRSRSLVAVAALSLVAVGVGLAPVSAAAAGLPDLMLGVSAPASVVHNATFSYSVKLHNDGPVPSPTPSVMGTLHRSFQITSVSANNPSFKCDFKNDDFVFGEIWACASETPLASQGTVIVTIMARAPAVAGSHSLQNMADPNNLVAESNEGNNQVNKSIQVN